MKSKCWTTSFFVRFSLHFNRNVNRSCVFVCAWERLRSPHCRTATVINGHYPHKAERKKIIAQTTTKVNDFSLRPIRVFILLQIYIWRWLSTKISFNCLARHKKKSEPFSKISLVTKQYYLVLCIISGQRNINERNNEKKGVNWGNGFAETSTRESESLRQMALYVVHTNKIHLNEK